MRRELGRGARDVGRARVVGMVLVIVALAAGAMLMLRSLGGITGALPAPKGRLESVEMERRAAAVHAAVVVTRAAEARAAATPLVARAESLGTHVLVERTGQLRVQDSMLVTVPPLVTERLQADSAAISALSVALTWDARAAAAQEDRINAETQVDQAARLTIAQLERERRPRCGRRCGMVLGAASVVALGIVVQQARWLIHP